MSNISLFGVLVITLIIFIFSVMKVRKEKLSIGKFVSLVLLPSILVGIGAYVISLYSYFFEVEKYEYVPSPFYILFPAVYGLFLMLPALMFYAVHTLSLEKRFSPSKWKLFMWTGLLGGVSTLPYLTIVAFPFIAVPMITGSLSMMIVYFFSSRNK